MPQKQENRPTPDRINKAYKAGYITAAERNDKMRRLADANLEDIIADQGIVKTYFTQTLKHVQANWEDLVKMADEYKPAQAGSKEQNTVGAAANEGLQTLRNAGRIMLAEIGMLTAPFQAFGEVNGATARRWAQDAGASPGLAAVIAVAVETGSNFVPVGKLSQAFAKGVQKNVPEVAAAVKRVAGAGKTEGKNLMKEAKALKSADKLGDEAIAKALLDDGVKPQGLEGFVDDVAKLMEPAKPAPAPDFYSSLRKYHNEIKEVTEVKHLADIEKEANKLGIHLDDLKALVGGDGKPLSPAQIKAYLNTLDEPTTNLIENARQVLKGDPEAAIRQDTLLGDYFSYSPTFRKAEVEAGRTVKVLDADPRMKSITEMMKAWDPENMAKLDITAARRTVAEDLVAMADEQEKLKALQIIGAGSDKGNAPSFWAKMREAYTNLLLARPVTQVRNFLGNSYAAGTSVVERELAGWLSIDDAQGVVKGEGAEQVRGMMAGIADGITGFKDAFKNVDDAGKLDFIPHQIGGKLGRLINVPGDSVRGMDNFFKAMLKRGDYYALAMRQGQHQGLEGQALADYVSRRVNVPTQTMLEHASSFADSQTFANDLGTLGKWAQGIQKVPGMVALFPFMKTPMNLAKYAWNRTPGLQFLSHSLYDDILAGGERGDMAVARLTLSNVMGMFWYGLAQQGLITGGGPSDPQLKRAWSAVKQPYSIHGKDGWYPIVGIEPGTTTINLIADFAEIRNQLDDPTAEQTAMAIGLSGVRDIVDKSYWQTVGQLVDFLGAVRTGEEPGRNAMRIAQGPAVTVASGGPLGASVARTIDPVRREARSFMDQIRARVPGYSAELPPMRDGYGDPLLVPQSLGHEWMSMVSPFVYKPDEQDRIKKEGGRLQVKMPMFPWSLGGKVRDDFDLRTALPGEPLPVELSPQQRDRWQTIYRDIMRGPQGIEAMVLDRSEYQNAPFAAQREMFMNYLATARSQAKEVLLSQDKELAKKTVSATAGQIKPMLGEQDQPKVDAQAREALDLIDSLPTEQADNLMRWGIMGSGAERDQEVIRQQLSPGQY